jgi:glycosyltransferase involved in cell wall biosynthesis
LRCLLPLAAKRDPHSAISPYFPQLLLAREPEKPIRVLPEGIQLSVEYKSGDSPFHYQKLLTGHPGIHRLERRYLGNPMLVNVGRLSFEKGQHRLVKAWSASRLSRIYNLLLVGGNQKKPEGEELTLIERINTLMEHAAHLRGRFCLLGALPNREVRLLERSMETILGEDGPSPKTLKQVAQRGQSYAREAFGIEKVSDAFSDYYGKLFSR